MLVVDGTDPELVRGIMETEMVSIDDRHKKNIGFWDNVAGMGPAWGMIGTLVGLIMMLYHMEDASTIGPAMAVALVTTFYGSLLANWICTPIATKLKAINNAEMQVKEGDRVIYSRYSGTEVKLEDEEYIIVKQSDILAVVK